MASLLIDNVKNGTDSIGISSKLSATVQNATLAARELAERHIRFIDSLNLPSWIGLLVMKAADLHDEGLSLVDIEAVLKNSVKKMHTSFAIDRPDYLHMGGSCSAMESIAGSMLKIRSLIEVRSDGTLGVHQKMRGQRYKLLDVMLEDFLSHLDEIDLQRVFLAHSDSCDGDIASLAGNGACSGNSYHAGRFHHWQSLRSGNHRYFIHDEIIFIL